MEKFQAGVITPVHILDFYAYLALKSLPGSLRMRGTDCFGVIRVGVHEVTARVQRPVWRNAPESSLHTDPFFQHLASAPPTRFFLVPLNDTAPAPNFS